MDATCQIPQWTNHEHVYDPRIFVREGTQLTVRQGTSARPEHSVLYLPNVALSRHPERKHPDGSSARQPVLDYTIERGALSGVLAGRPGIREWFPPGVYLCCGAELGDDWDNS